MDKSCHSSVSDDSTNTATNAAVTSGSGSSNQDQYLRHLNKISHKISKPIRRPAFDQNIHRPPTSLPPVPPPPPSVPQQGLQQQQQQHQPPVYNINKNDFRDVVQKLTGSPAHERFSTPPPIQPPKQQSSRLQRIRPPPLAQLGNRPPPLLNSGTQMNPPPSFGGIRPIAPLSPLPPFPSVHASAESPISAYMRFLQNSGSSIDSDSKRFSGLSPLAPLVSPRWNNSNLSLQQPLPPPAFPSPTSAGQPHFTLPASPLPFGCLPSPRSPYPLLSPGMMFSPATGGQLGFNQFPISPRMPTTSPRWKDV